MAIKPKLRTLDLSMIVVSLVIGVGIFRTPSIVAQQAGSPFIFFLAWTLGGIVSLCGALTFAEIGARYTVPGGFYRIFSYCYHPAFALMMTWVLLLTMGASFASVALIGAEYISPLILSHSWQNPSNINLLAVGFILCLAIINFGGIRAGANTQNFLSGLKILLILLICLAAFSSPAAQLPEPQPQTSISWWSAIGISLISVFFSYGGYQQTINFGGDIKDGKRNIPSAILKGMGVIICLYLTINYAFYYVLGFTGIQEAPLVAAEVGKAYLGPTGASIISVIIFISVLGFLNATLMSTPRMYYAMAEDRVLPPIFKQLNSRTQVQEFALCFFVAVAIISLYALETFENILNYVMFIDSIALATSASAIFILRWNARKNDQHQGFRIPLFPLIPLIFVLFLSGVAINIFITETSLALWGCFLFVLGYPLYLLMRKLYPNA